MLSEVAIAPDNLVRPYQPDHNYAQTVIYEAHRAVITATNPHAQLDNQSTFSRDPKTLIF